MKHVSPHDALIRYTFGQREHAAALMHTVLPRAEFESQDWTTLTLLPGTRLSARLRRHQTDLLFSVCGGSSDRSTLLYLLVEHSSRVDRHMAFRMLDYSVGIWRDLLRENPRMRRYPRILPVVIHHGRRAWRVATDFAEMVDDPPVGCEASRQPRYRYGVLSSASMTPRQIDELAL